MTDDSESSTADSDPSAESEADPKTTEDGTEIRRNVPAEQWETVGRRALATLVEDRKIAVDDAVSELISAIQYGAPVDETHLQNFREAIADLEDAVEHELTDLIDDATPFEQIMGRVPEGRVAAALDVEMDQLNRVLELVESGELQDDDDSADDSGE